MIRRGLQRLCGKLQVPPLRCASVGMTNLVLCLSKQQLSGKTTTPNLVIPTGANPDFLSRCTRQIHVCAYPLRKAHALNQHHQTPQEIRGSVVEGPAVLFVATQTRQAVPLRI
jgi:hypothetical protein